MNTLNESAAPQIDFNPTGEPETQEISPGRVLIVEDEPELVELLDYNLRRHGFHTDIAGDGLTACRRIGAERPELILLDLMLPDLDGREICAMVRSHPDPELARTPIIMLTAMGTLDDRVRGVELGADIYLTKPYSVREVLLHVRHLIDQRRTQHQAEQALKRLQSETFREQEWQQMLLHELRNQMLVIAGYSQRLNSKEPGLASETSREYVRAIQRSSNYLGNLAEEFMLIRQIETDRQPLPGQPVNPFWLLEELVELYRPHAARHGQALTMQTLGVSRPCELNSAALRLILSNLLENATKYGTIGGEITVGMTVGKADLAICIEDDGPGIDPEDQERIFEKFYRGSPAQNSQRPGHGLGLYTARTLATAMGGELSVSNRQPDGARFTLKLPI